MYESMRAGGSATALMENLQAQLKQREGEVVQLQMEIAALERVRDNLTVELAKLTNKVDTLETANEELQETSVKFADLEQKYHTMLSVSAFGLERCLRMPKCFPHFRCTERKSKKPKNSDWTFST